MEEIKVSVIVPCYKVEAYLEKCIRSLALQSLRELEIIAVDDGSPDRCGALLEDLQKDVPRLRVFHKENGGLSDARNFGLDKARGKFVAFLDGDDWVDLDLYQVLCDRANETGADLVACPIRYVWEDRESKIVSPGVPPFAEGPALKPVFTRFYPAAWNKLYRRALLEESGVRFKTGAWFEDVEFNHRLFPYLRRIASTDRAAIHYVQRQGSVTARPDARLFDYLTNFESILAFFRERGLLEAWKPELEYAAARYLLATFLKRAGGLDDADFERALDGATAFLKREFPRWRRNPYLWKNGVKGFYLLIFSPGLARWMRKRTAA